jgi:hypothetical protein
VNTDEVIRLIAKSGAPVHRLPPPWRRALIWLAIGGVYIVAVIALHPGTPDLSAMRGARFFLQEAAAVTTAVTAAWVAFCTTIPGYDRRLPLIPLAALVVWLGVLGGGTLGDWLQFGRSGMALRPDWDCVVPSLVVGWLPLAAMLVMLRRGAPLRPNISVALGVLAVAALCNIALCLAHLHDATIMLLVWHLGGAIVISLLAGCIGRLILNWRQARAHAMRQGLI